MYILGPPCLLVLGVKREHSSFKDHCCVSEASVCFLGLRTGLYFFICGKMFSSLLFFLPLTPLPLQHSLIGKLIFFFFYQFLFVCFLLLYFPPFLLGMLQQEVQKRSCVRLCPDTPLVCWTTVCAHAWGHTCLPRNLGKRLHFPYLWPVFLAPCTAPGGVQKLKCHDTW